MGLRHILFGALMWAVFIYALRRGGWQERVAAGCTVVGTYLTVLAYSPLAVRYTHVETPVVFIDSAIFAVLLCISLRSQKFWPLWLTAMQALTVFAHLSPFVPHMLPWGYGRAAAVWSWMKLIVLVFVIREANRVERSRSRLDPRR